MKTLVVKSTGNRIALVERNVEVSIASIRTYSYDGSFSVGCKTELHAAINAEQLLQQIFNSRFASTRKSIDKSKVMKLAWKLFRGSKLNFSECLKSAWRIEKINNSTSKLN